MAVLTPSKVRPKSLAQRSADHEVRMKVRSYGKLADLLGTEREVRIDAPCTVAELRVHLAAECPEACEALNSRRLRACIGNAIVPDSHTLALDEQIELLAPVSGG